MQFRSLWQRRALVLLLFFLACKAWSAETHTAGEMPARQPAIAIIIDDLGSHVTKGRRAIDLPGPVALSFLPDGKHTAELARLAHSSEKEIMLPLPMQAVGQRTSHHHRGELMVDMQRHEFLDTLARNIAAVPHVSGINNHRGSLLTSTSSNMAWLMQALYEYGELFFVDSRTTAATVAADMASAYGVPGTSRNVFLDNEPAPAAIRKQFRELVSRAHRDGTALAIGHPHPATLKVLAEELPRLDSHGLQLVTVSQLIARQKERRIAWQGSLSR